MHIVKVARKPVILFLLHIEKICSQRDHANTRLLRKFFGLLYIKGEQVKPAPYLCDLYFYIRLSVFSKNTQRVKEIDESNVAITTTLEDRTSSFPMFLAII